MARRKPPANLQAYDYYLLGIEAKHKETKEDNIRAQELFRKALELDPRFRARLYRVGFDLWLRDLAELHRIQGPILARLARRRAEGGGPRSV